MVSTPAANQSAISTQVATIEKSLLETKRILKEAESSVPPFVQDDENPIVSYFKGKISKNDILKRPSSIPNSFRSELDRMFGSNKRLYC